LNNSIKEPAAFIFPLPAELKEQYANWSRSFQQLPCGEIQEGSEAGGNTPIFIPVYPAYPGFMPYPPYYPPSTGTGHCSGGSVNPPGINPFILFLILILLLIIFKKDQIIEAIRKLLIKPEQICPSGDL